MRSRFRPCPRASSRPRRSSTATSSRAACARRTPRPTSAPLRAPRTPRACTPWPTACGGASRAFANAARSTGRVACRGVSLADRLAARTLELIDIPSESRDESALAAHVLGVLRDGGVAARDAGDTCVLAGVTERSERPLVLLGGHFDTVPAQDNRPGRRAGGAVHGLGASDMKGALAVMIELALARAGGAVDLGFVFFGREELPVAESALTPLLAREPGLLGADVVLMMEPTANVVQAGCVGNINATWTFSGRSGHSARPWLADNALAHAARGVLALEQVPSTEYDYDGLLFREAVSVTQLQGGIAQNVIPDRVVAHVNYLYPPGLTAEEAERRLRRLTDGQGELVIDSNAPSA